MKSLKKLLSDSSKARRNRRNVLNILVTILSWLVEFFGSFTVFLGSFIFGHDNSIITLSLQTMTMLLYFIILPLTILVNEVKTKRVISESRWYQTLIQAIGCGSNKVEPPSGPSVEPPSPPKVERPPLSQKHFGSQEPEMHPEQA